METGKALGGPRDNVRLSASASWDGRIILRPPKDTGAITRYYPGRYAWSTGMRMWVWHVDLSVANQPVAQTSRAMGHSKKP